MTLTARHVVKTLGEHALAFWNYYNPNGKPLDQIDTELSEDTINGILLTCMYDTQVSQEVFSRRCRRLVELSSGIIPEREACTLVARAFGYRYARNLKSYWKAHKAAPNLLYLAQPAVLTGHSESKQGRARNIARVTQLYGDRNGLYTHIDTLDNITMQKLDELCHAMRVFMLTQDRKLSKQRVAQRLGYGSFNALKGTLLERGTALNLVKFPDAISAEELKGIAERRAQYNINRRNTASHDNN